MGDLGPFRQLVSCSPCRDRIAHARVVHVAEPDLRVSGVVINVFDT